MEKSCGLIPLIETEGGVKVALVQHLAGHWGFPKGHGEGNECDIETAQRELYEELGVECQRILEGYSFVESYTYLNPQGKVVPKTVTYFVGYLDPDAKIQIQELELLDYKICTFNQAEKLLTFDRPREILLEVKNTI